jgi:hypothetical protein
MVSESKKIMSTNDYNIVVRNILTQLDYYCKKGLPIPDQMWTIVEQWSRVPFETPSVGGWSILAIGKLYVKSIIDFPPEIRKYYIAHSFTGTHVVLADSGVCMSICNSEEEAEEMKKKLEELLTLPVTV